MNKFLKYILDFIFPIECVGCGEEGKWLCEHCFSKIEFNKKQICPLCGQIFKLGYSCVCTVGGQELNQEKIPLTPFTKGGTTGKVDVYITFVDLKKNQQILQLIHKLKYGFAQGAAEDLARIGAEFLKKNKVWEKLGMGGLGIMKGGENGDGEGMGVLCIPVPLHKKRLLWRGFNQSELILKEMQSRIMNYELGIMNAVNDILIRKKNTLFQGKTKMKEKDRILNMREAFEILNSDVVKNKTVVLFDDVITSGATIEECARALKKFGVARVIAMAVGKG